MALMSIIVDIAANTAKLEEGMRRAQATVEDFAAGVQRVVELLAVAEIARFTEEMISAGAAMQRAVEISGDSAANFQRLAYAAATVGVNADQLASTMVRMGRNLSEAGSGAKTQKEALEALGLTFKELKDLSPVDQMLLLGQQITALKSPMDQDRAAMALFGRSVADLLPLFKMSREELNALMGRAPILSDDQLKSLHDAHTALSEITQTIKLLGEALASLTAGPLAQFAKQMNDIATGKKSFWQYAKEAYEQAVGRPEGGGTLAQFDAQRAAALAQARAAATAPPPPEMLPEVTVTAPSPPGYPGEKPWDFHEQLAEELLRINGRVERETINEAQRTTEQVQREMEKRMRYEQQFFLEFWGELQDIADSGAQSLQQSFAQFFFDPVNVGLKGLVLGFANTVRQMLAEAAAADLMHVLFGPMGAQGAGGMFGGVLSGLFGATGTTGVSASDLSGYSGSVADVLSGMAYGGGASVKHAGFAPTYNIDARGADADRIMTIMPTLLTQSAEKAKRDILDAFNRGGYPAPRRA